MVASGCRTARVRSSSCRSPWGDQHWRRYFSLREYRIFTRITDGPMPLGRLMRITTSFWGIFFGSLIASSFQVTLPFFRARPCRAEKSEDDTRAMYHPCCSGLLVPSSCAVLERMRAAANKFISVGRSGTNEGYSPLNLPPHRVPHPVGPTLPSVLHQGDLRKACRNCGRSEQDLREGHWRSAPSNRPVAPLGVVIPRASSRTGPSPGIDRSFPREPPEYSPRPTLVRWAQGVFIRLVAEGKIAARRIPERSGGQRDIEREFPEQHALGQRQVTGYLPKLPTYKVRPCTT